MFQKFYPVEDIRSTYDINFEEYYEKGYRGVIFDIDNTLVRHICRRISRQSSYFIV